MGPGPGPWQGAQRACLSRAAGRQRWHFQHGPIDLIIGLEGPDAALDEAIARAWERLPAVLPELVAELPLLRAAVATGADPIDNPLSGPVARRMWLACRGFARGDGVFVTAMAAVAGSVAQDILNALWGPPLFSQPKLSPTSLPQPTLSQATFLQPTPSQSNASQSSASQSTPSQPTPSQPTLASPGLALAWVNNGGDIAWRSDDPERVFRVGLPELGADAQLSLRPGQGAWGVATSGWRGRSQSLGIADHVTVLATHAALADAAATLIANEVSLDHVDPQHPAITRLPASQVKDNSDLGERLVTVAVAALRDAEIASALDRGLHHAQRLHKRGDILGAVLCLQGQWRLCGAAREAFPAPGKTLENRV